jgi:hypothetical protein
VACMLTQTLGFGVDRAGVAEFAAAAAPLDRRAAGYVGVPMAAVLDLVAVVTRSVPGWAVWWSRCGCCSRWAATACCPRR